MEKTTLHKFSELLMAVGFLLFVIGGLGSAILALDPNNSMFVAIIGFIMFLMGVEIYLKTRPEH